jgi:bifunctional oligoribonuclease and PAP phosphatase NrnA
MSAKVRADCQAWFVPPDDLASAVSLLRTARDVILLAHVNPDADALGSAIALGMALRRRGATVRVSFGAPAEVPETLRGLDPDGLVVPASDVPPSAELLVALDCGSQARLGRLADRVPATVAAGGSVLVVDHHASNTRFGTHHVIDDRAEATVVLVLRLLDELGVELDEQLARCVYAGLMMDTSMFRRAAPGTHRLAARLLDTGLDAEALARELVDSHPFAWMKMLAAVLGRARLEPDAAGGFGLVHTVVYQSDMDGARLEEVESVVDILRTTTEAEVAAVLKETGPGRWSASLRAVGKVDVSSAAVELGGGGHRLAAGFTALGTAEEILAALRAALDNPVLL